MWLTLPRLVGVLSPLPILVACAAAGARGANVITAPELSRSKAGNAYDAIHQMRPEMLRTRDPVAILYFRPRRPLVAMDNTLVGGVEVLRALPTGKVVRIEYVDSWVAAKRYGTGFWNGVMLIETRADSEPEFAAGRRNSSEKTMHPEEGAARATH
jgi:hypothetical protein